MKQKLQKSPEEKLAIVLEGIKGETTITDICIKHGVSQTWYYTQRDKIIDLAKEWHNRPLENIYLIIFFDAIHYKVTREGKVTNLPTGRQVKPLTHVYRSILTAENI